MLFTTSRGVTFDTDKDLTAEERHVLQKLFLWESMATSLQQFREKREQALLKGWNGSGPIREGQALRAIVEELEQRVRIRLGAGP